MDRTNVNMFFNALWRNGNTFTTYHKPRHWGREKPDVAHWHTSIDSALQLRPPPTKNNWWFCVNPSVERPPTNAKGNTTPKKWIGAQNAYIQLANCLYGDFDAKDFGSKEATLNHIESLDTEPSFIVDSGNGYHCYWLFDEAIYDMALYTRMLRGWVAYIQSDDGAKSISRKLRIPGTINHKAEPLPVEFVKFDPDISYDISEFEDYTLPEYHPPDISAYADGIETDDIKNALLHLASHRCDHYGSWFQILAAIKNGLGEAGRPIAEHWSSGGQGNEHQVFDKTWDAIKQIKDGDTITVATLFGAFRTDSPQEFEEWRASKAPLVIDDESIRFAYPERARNGGFTTEQLKEFEDTGIIQELEEAQSTTDIDAFDYSRHNNVVELPVADEFVIYSKRAAITEINGVKIKDYVKNPRGNYWDVFATETHSAYDVAYYLNRWFDVRVKTSDLNGKSFSEVFIWDSKIGWVMNDAVLISLAQYCYNRIYLKFRDITDFAQVRHHRYNISKLMADIYKSLAIIAEDVTPLLQAAPPTVIRTPKGYFDLAKRKYLEPCYDYAVYQELTIPDEIPSYSNSEEIWVLLYKIFIPQEFWGTEMQGHYHNALRHALGQTYSNETNPRIFHYVWGHPSTGKSLFARLNQATFGNLANTAISTAILKKDSDPSRMQEVAALDGKLMGMCPDILNEELTENINNLAGDGLARGKKNYVGFLDVPIKFTLWFGANHPPNLDHAATVDRLWLWQLENELNIDASDDYIKSLIPQYFSAICDSVKFYQDNRRKIRKPQFMIDIIRSMQDESNTALNYLHKCFEPMTGGALPLSFVLENYANYCSEVLDVEQLSKKEFIKVWRIQPSVRITSDRKTKSFETMFSSGCYQHAPTAEPQYKKTRFVLGLKFLGLT